MEKKKIEIILYYDTIASPFMEAFKNNGYTNYFSSPKEENKPDPVSKRMSKTRAYYEFNNFDLIIRCVEDILPPFKEGVLETNKRNSQQIYNLLCGYIKNDAPDLVISVNSAASTLNIEQRLGSSNGSVYIGSEYFMFYGGKYSKSSINDLKPYVYSVSQINEDIFNILQENEKEKIASYFKIPPNLPASPLTLNLGKNYKTLTCSANIMDMTTYDSGEKLNFLMSEITRIALNVLPVESIFYSIGTLHGIVNMATIEASNWLNKKISTMFVSAIYRRCLNYKDDVDENGVQENFSCYNGGIAVAALIEKIGQNIDIYM